MSEVSERIGKAIDAKSPLNVDGTDYSLRMTRFEEPLPFQTQAFTIEVEAQAGGNTHRGEIHIGEDTLKDEPYVVSCLVHTVERVIRGELPPGVRELL